MILYHGTNFENLSSILENGIETRNCENTVYLCKTPEDCLKFAKIRGTENVLIFKVRIPKKEVYETFDHNKRFFGCQCYGIGRTIKSKEIVSYIQYDLTFKPNK